MSQNLLDIRDGNPRKRPCPVAGSDSPIPRGNRLPKDRPVKKDPRPPDVFAVSSGVSGTSDALFQIRHFFRVKTFPGPGLINEIDSLVRKMFFGQKLI